MKWKPQRGKRADRNVIDLRGAPKSSGRSSRGGLGGLPIPSGMAGLGGGAGVIVVVVVLALQLFGGGGGSGGFDIGQILGPGAAAPSAEDGEQAIPASQDPDRDLRDFSAFVFNDAQDVWKESFAADGERYSEAQLVLYDGRVSTDGCGSATSAVGPFYCPSDSRVYLDLSFYEDMERQLEAPGDFAWAYVIAHEIGHHVQNVLGTNARVTQESNANPDDANELSVRTELQADCYSGVWAKTVFAEGALESGDLDEAFTASEAVGDDRLQAQAGQDIDRDSFTHGSSEQRRSWFERGYEGADPSSCDTFSPDDV